MKLSFNILFDSMVKAGALQFENQTEKVGFEKIAQGQIDPMMLQQMLMQQGGPMMQQQPQQSDAAPVMESGQVSQQPEQVPVESNSQQNISAMPATDQSTLSVLEGISQKDIESLIKIINAVTSLKSQYDIMKKQQMEMIKGQTQTGAV